MFVVIQDKCIGCKKCEKVCPVSAIKVENKKAVIDYTRCICCGECARNCPKGAITFIPGRLVFGGRGRGRRWGRRGWRCRRF